MPDHPAEYDYSNVVLMWDEASILKAIAPIDVTAQDLQRAIADLAMPQV